MWGAATGGAGAAPGAGAAAGGAAGDTAGLAAAARSRPPDGQKSDPRSARGCASHENDAGRAAQSTTTGGTYVKSTQTYSDTHTHTHTDTT